jgi:hypothetical protein
VGGYGDSLPDFAVRGRCGLPDPEHAYLTGNVENIDDFSACRITRKEDWVDLYAKPYYFGCEVDDPMNATAFGRNNPFGSKLNAIFSSDIGHFDVIDMRDPLPEAYELVEDGHITADNFRDSPSPMRSSCGARRTRAFSRARASPRKPPQSSPPAKPRPSPPPNSLIQQRRGPAAPASEARGKGACVRRACPAQS